MGGPAVPRTLGRYEVLGEIGRDGAAVTWRARDPAVDRVVSIRALVETPGASASEREAFEARFLAEARRALLFVHPALPATVDFGKDPATGALFVVREDVAGTPLECTLVRGEPLPWRDALGVAAQVGRGLQALHETGVVHQDVRPGGIVVVGSGACRLADPGLPRFETDGSPPAAVGRGEAIAALYLSPEQAVGERVDPRADVFALGALLHRLLTGRDAFEADGPQRILARILHDRPAPPSRLVAGLPAGVDAVLARALAKPRKDRYADAASFCDDLDDLLAGRAPRSASAAPRGSDTGRFLAGAADATVGDGSVSSPPDRRPVVRGLVGLVALALVLGLELLRRDLDAPRAPAVGPPAPDDQPRPEAPFGSGGSSDLPSLEPPPSARLLIDFRHTLEAGTLVVRVDGATVLERRVSGAVTKRFLGIKLREGSLRQVVEVPPGRHAISVRVRWGDEERTDTIAGSFAAGATRKLSARVGRIGRRLSVEWQ